MAYNIVRHYLNAYPNKRIIERGLTLEEAQAHCRSPESSSETCTTPSKKAVTRRVGSWFDGYSKA